MNSGLELTLDDIFEPQGPLVVGTSNIGPDELVLETVPLNAVDIAELIDQGPSRSYATVQHTRAYHHIAALKLAAGVKAGVVANSLHLTASTLSRLQKDPQFRELVEGYREQLVDQTINTFGLMELITKEAALAIHERLIGDERDQIPLESLRRIGETFSDRTGHSPVRRSQALNLHASGSISDLGLQRVKDRHGEDAFYRKELSQPALEEGHAQEALDQGAETSIAAVFEPVEEREVKCSSGEG